MPATQPLCPYIATSAEYRPDRFYRYAELTELLRAWESAYPQLASLGSLGRTYQGRELWCMTLTNAATGPHDAKPAYYIDANVHAGEVTGSAVALHTIHHLLSLYGEDPLCTRLLDGMTFYVVPRVSADGAELYLDGPGMLRSSVRPYPDAPEGRGLVRQDVNGDGWIATMRLADPTGPWKVSTKDPRLMVRRAPDETGGTYYWLLPEGLIQGYAPAKDGLLGEIVAASSRYGLDLNRNFPIDWEPEHQTRGAGPYPLSEPETRAIADFLLARTNVTGTQHYHTFAGMILRPSSRRADGTLPPADLKRFQALGRLGTEETGYPCISIYHEFTEEPGHLNAGMLLDWSYDQLGVFSFSTELWSLGKAAGVAAADKPLDFYFGQGRSEDDDLAMLRWVDQHVGRFGYLDWRPFDHPQLGRVELGGWQTKYVIQNAPGPFLPELCQRNTAFTLRAAACAPYLAIAETRVEALEPGLFRVQAIAENTGYLPTNVTEQAVATKRVRPDRLRLDGAEVLGEPEHELGFVPGRSGQDEPPAVFLAYGRPNRRKAEWLVRATTGTVVTLTLESQRGGRVQREVTLA